MQTVAIGFRAKTGKAIAVALVRGTAAPVYFSRWEVALHDPKWPATSQPHHEVMELPWAEAQSAVRPIERRIERVAMEALSRLLKECESKDLRVGGIGVVGSPDRKLESIGNPHIRAHAAEGILFRRVIESAAGHLDLPWRSFSDRRFDESGLTQLREKPDQVRVILAALGKAAGKPWRVDERTAAVAAWIML